MLFTYGMGVGFQALLHAHVTRGAITNVIVPVNYWRTLEYRLALDALEPAADDLILDVGSPKLLSLYLAQRIGASVCASDIEEYFIRDYTRFRSLRGIPEERYRLLKADGRSLQFGDASFTKVYSISVLEHIPDRGDSECMREIARVLQPGGRFVATVPFAPEGRDEFRSASDFYWSGSSNGKNGDGKIFFQRRYCESDLYERIVKPSGMDVVSIGYFGERINLGEGNEVSDYLPPLTGPIQPLASRIFHQGPAKDWREIAHPLGAIIVLQKG